MWPKTQKHERIETLDKQESWSLRRIHLKDLHLLLSVARAICTIIACSNSMISFIWKTLKSIMEPIRRFLPIVKHSTSGWLQLDHVAVETQLDSFSSVLREDVKNNFCNENSYDFIFLQEGGQCHYTDWKAAKTTKLNTWKWSTLQEFTNNKLLEVGRWAWKWYTALFLLACELNK